QNAAARAKNGLADMVFIAQGGAGRAEDQVMRLCGLRQSGLYVITAVRENAEIGNFRSRQQGRQHDAIAVEDGTAFQLVADGKEGDTKRAMDLDMRNPGRGQQGQGPGIKTCSGLKQDIALGV